MKNILDLQLQEVITAAHYMPCVSLIMPFEPKMANKHELEQRLKSHQQRIERQLIEEYPSDKALPVLEKFQQIIRSINYSSYKKSVAIYVSPLLQKIYYLDIDVEEKMIIDESFEIRDLVNNKKEKRSFLLVHIGGHYNCFYLFENSKLQRIRTNSFAHLKIDVNDRTEQIEDDSLQESETRKEILLEKLLRLTDHALEETLKDYPYPVFFIGSQKAIGTYKKVSRSLNKIAGFIPGSFESLHEKQVATLLEPHINEWKRIFTQTLLMRIEIAFSAQRLTYGIENVWREASRKNCKLLVVEKNYMCSAKHGANANEIFKVTAASGMYIKDAVDDVIEMVLLNGGDVEFVDNGSLRQYEHIVLIRYF